MPDNLGKFVAFVLLIHHTPFVAFALAHAVTYAVKRKQHMGSAKNTNAE